MAPAPQAERHGRDPRSILFMQCVSRPRSSWLYDGDKPAAHLNAVAEAAGNLDNAMAHVAFVVDRLDDALSRLDRLGIDYVKPRHVPGSQVRQCFVNDPNGVAIELQGP